MIFNAAMVSTNFDVNIASIISEALVKIGVEGILQIEPGRRKESELKVKDMILRFSSHLV